jgi:hypothetical protein
MFRRRAESQAAGVAPLALPLTRCSGEDPVDGAAPPPHPARRVAHAPSREPAGPRGLSLPDGLDRSRLGSPFGHRGNQTPLEGGGGLTDR